MRHLYDVYAIASVEPSLLDDTLLEHFAVLVHEDARQFENQFPLFVEDPCGQMQLALSELEQDHTFEKEYQALFQELVFGHRSRLVRHGVSLLLCQNPVLPI